MLALHEGSRDDLEIYPNLWAGVGLVRGGAGTALVGSHEEVADRIEEYHDARHRRVHPVRLPAPRGGLLVRRGRAPDPRRARPVDQPGAREPPGFGALRRLPGRLMRSRVEKGDVTTIVRPEPPTALDPGALRRAFGAFPSGVVAVAAEVDGVPVGMVASSFTSVSLEPALVSFSIANTSSTWPLLRRSARLGLSVLADHHDHVCRQLAGPAAQRFDGLSLAAQRRRGDAVRGRGGDLRLQHLP